MDYRLEVFRRVAEEQSVSAAARLMRISQPAVTQHIRLLEERYGVPLFVRSRRGVLLTEAGVTLLEHARKVVAMEEDVAARLRTPEAILSGNMRLGVSTTILQYYLPGVLTEFKRRHPAASVELLEGNSDAVIGALLAQRIDLGLIEAPCRRRDLRVREFFEDEIVPIASGSHPLATARSVSLEKFLKHPLVLRELGSGTRQSVEAALQRLKIDSRQLDVAQEFPSTEAIKRAVIAGMGVGFASRISITHELENGSLAALNVRQLEIRRPFSTILPLGPDPVGIRQVFLGFLR